MIDSLGPSKHACEAENGTFLGNTRHLAFERDVVMFPLPDKLSVSNDSLNRCEQNLSPAA
jgi:hypothetical protein